MPENSFDTFRESATTRRSVILAGVVVLVLAGIAALAAAVISLTAGKSEQSMGQDAGATETVTVPAPAPASEEEREGLAALTGTYTGTFSSAISSEDSREWSGVVALTGSTGLLTYPDNSCQVFLDGAEVNPDNSATVTYQAQGITSQCSPSGTWTFTSTDTGMLGEYSEDGQQVVSAELTRE